MAAYRARQASIVGAVFARGRPAPPRPRFCAKVAALGVLFVAGERHRCSQLYRLAQRGPFGSANRQRVFVHFQREGGVFVDRGLAANGVRIAVFS
jgi:hypothetical protein